MIRFSLFSSSDQLRKLSPSNEGKVPLPLLNVRWACFKILRLHPIAHYRLPCWPAIAKIFESIKIQKAPNTYW